MSKSCPGTIHRIAAFTLIEIMVVVAIMGIILAAGAPSLVQMMKKHGFRKTVSDVIDVCTVARSQAILKGSTTEVVFYPQERRCEVAGSSGKSVPGGLARSVRLDEDTQIEMLDVNLRDYRSAEVARIRFFPDGTSDEMVLILNSKGKFVRIDLEITTGLASVRAGLQ